MDTASQAVWRNPGRATEGLGRLRKGRESPSAELADRTGEPDDPQIKAALAETYGRFLAVIRTHVAAHRGAAPRGGGIAVYRVVWTIPGLGTMANIGRELGLLSPSKRERLLVAMRDLMLDGWTGPRDLGSCSHSLVC